MIELREKDRVNICRLADKVLPSGSILWAYGSRVKGTGHDTSDLNLVLISPEDEPIDIEYLQRFKLALQDSTIPIFVQVMDWNYMPEHFKDNILQRYEVLYRVPDTAE